MSVLLYGMKPHLQPLARNRAIQFVGQNTIWIYLWHILFVYLAKTYIDSWVLQWIGVLGGALLLTVVQQVIGKWIKKQYIPA